MMHINQWFQRKVGMFLKWRDRHKEYGPAHRVASAAVLRAYNTTDIYAHLEANGHVLFYPPSLDPEPAIAAYKVLSLWYDLSPSIRKSVERDIYEREASMRITDAACRIGYGTDQVSVPVDDKDVWTKRVNDLLISDNGRSDVAWVQRFNDLQNTAFGWTDVDFVVALDDAESVTLLIRCHGSSQ